MFGTEKGSKYYKVGKLWQRVSSEGIVYNNIYYIGSIDPSKNPAFEHRGEEVNLGLIMGMVDEKVILGFTTAFVKGNVPLGFAKTTVNTLRGITGKIVKEGEVAYIPHVGHKITRVF